MVSAIFIIVLILLAIFAPAGRQAPRPARAHYQNNSNALDAFGSPTGPTRRHPFGVDQLGRDVFSRVIYGSRVSLEVGIFGTVIATIVGTVLGLLAGFYRGWVDTIISRLVDVFLAFPVLVLGLGIGAACGVRGCAGGLIKPGLGTVIFIIAISSLHVHRPDRPRPGAVVAREGVRRGGALAGGVQPPDPLQGDPPQPGRADDRLLQPADSHQHPVRGRAVLLGGRHPAADRQLGPDDLRRRRRTSTPLGGTWSSPEWPCCSPCLRSTSSETACWTRSTRAGIPGEIVVSRSARDLSITTGGKPMRGSLRSLTAMAVTGLLAVGVAACGSSSARARPGEDASSSSGSSTTSIPLKPGENPVGQTLTGKKKGGTLTVYSTGASSTSTRARRTTRSTTRLTQATSRPLFTYPPNSPTRCVRTSLPRSRRRPTAASPTAARRSPCTSGPASTTARRSTAR